MTNSDISKCDAYWQKWETYLQKWGGGREICFELLRIYLGIGLFVRGLIFFTSSGGVVLRGFLMEFGHEWMTPALVAHYVILADLAGCLIMALGLLTRIAALVQIPVMIGAVFFVHWKEGLFALGQSLEFSTMILSLLLLILSRGGGRWSIDYAMASKSRNGSPA